MKPKYKPKSMIMMLALGITFMQACEPKEYFAQYQSLTENTTCRESDISWVSSISKTEKCTGPWRYQKYNQIPQRHCTYNTCRHIDFGRDSMVEAATGASQHQYASPSKSCYLACTGGIPSIGNPNCRYICDWDFSELTSYRDKQCKIQFDNKKASVQGIAYFHSINDSESKYWTDRVGYSGRIATFRCNVKVGYYLVVPEKLIIA